MRHFSNREVVECADRRGRYNKKHGILRPAGTSASLNMDLYVAREFLRRNSRFPIVSLAELDSVYVRHEISAMSVDITLASRGLMKRSTALSTTCAQFSRQHGRGGGGGHEETISSSIIVVSHRCPSGIYATDGRSRQVPFLACSWSNTCG